MQLWEYFGISSLVNHFEMVQISVKAEIVILVVHWSQLLCVSIKFANAIKVSSFNTSPINTLYFMHIEKEK
jgi:hypothetical protein